MEIIADNKPLLDKKKPKEDANLKKPTTSTNIKKEEKPAKKEEIIPKSEQKPEKKEEKPVPDTKPPAKKEETITVKDTNKETKDKIEENAKKSTDLKDLRADVKNSESEADRVRRLVDETTRKTNDVKGCPKYNNISDLLFSLQDFSKHRAYFGFFEKNPRWV